MAAVVIEFVAGPRCGETEPVERGRSPVPPLSIALPATGRDAAGSVYVRRDDHPDPHTDRWRYDHVPPG